MTSDMGLLFGLGMIGVVGGIAAIVWFGVLLVESYKPQTRGNDSDK